jgi:hypothetical protein
MARDIVFTELPGFLRRCFTRNAGFKIKTFAISVVKVAIHRDMGMVKG